MMITTTDNKQLEVDQRDLVQVNGVIGIRALMDEKMRPLQLTDDSAAKVRAAMQDQLPPRTEFDLFNLAAIFGRRDTLPFRVPGTAVEHKVECVIMEPCDIAMFASAIGVPSVGVTREVFARQLDHKRRRVSDRLEEQRQPTLDQDFDAPEVPQAWRDFARAIADIPPGAGINMAGMRARALELLGEKVAA